MLLEVTQPGVDRDLFFGLPAGVIPRADDQEQLDGKDECLHDQQPGQTSGPLGGQTSAPSTIWVVPSV